jgi:hypothetical protein
MRKWPIAAIAALLALGCGQPEKGEAPEKVASPEGTVAPVAEMIGGKFEGALTSIAEGDIGSGVGMLLDITLLTGPEAGLPEGFKDAIERARAAFAANDMAGGRKQVVAALGIWNPERGEDAAAPGPDTGTPGPLAQLVRDKIVAARDLMTRGDSKSSVTAILEALLLLSPAH